MKIKNNGEQKIEEQKKTVEEKIEEEKQKADAVTKKIEEQKQLLEKSNIKPTTSLKTLLATDICKKKFNDMLGSRSQQFIASLYSAISQNPKLEYEVSPSSVISSSLIAASLDLPVNQNLGFAYLIPYGNKCQFQMGWKGFVQLAMRSGQYESMNVSEVFEDEIELYNPITGEFKLKDFKNWKFRSISDKSKICGYVAFFKLLNGFKMTLYMTKSDILLHGKQYSKSFDSDSGNWKLRFDSMAKKTVLKLLLSRFGVMSVEMQKAKELDQAVILDDDKIEYIDNDSNDSNEGENIKNKIETKEEIK